MNDKIENFMSIRESWSRILFSFVKPLPLHPKQLLQVSIFLLLLFSTNFQNYFIKKGRSLMLRNKLEWNMQSELISRSLERSEDS